MNEYINAFLVSKPMDVNFRLLSKYTLEAKANIEPNNASF